MAKTQSKGGVGTNQYAVKGSSRATTAITPTFSQVAASAEIGPTQLAATLATSQDPHVLMILAQDAKTSPAVLSQILMAYKSGGKAKRKMAQALLANPSTPEPAIVQYFKNEVARGNSQAPGPNKYNDYWNEHSVGDGVLERSLSQPTLDVIAETHPHLVCAHPNTDPSRLLPILDKIVDEGEVYGSHYQSVVNIIASNPLTPSEVFDKHIDVEKYAADPRDDAAYITRTLLWGTNCPPKHLRKAADSPSAEIRAIAANHRNTPPEVLHRLVTDTDYHVKRSATANPNLPEADALILASSDDGEIRWRVLHNPTYTDNQQVLAVAASSPPVSPIWGDRGPTGEDERVIRQTTPIRQPNGQYALPALKSSGKDAPIWSVE